MSTTCSAERPANDVRGKVLTSRRLVSLERRRLMSWCPLQEAHPGKPIILSRHTSQETKTVCRVLPPASS